MGDRNDSKKKKKMKFLWRNFCKRRAMGPKTRKFHPTDIAKFCGRLFSSADLQKLGRILWVAGQVYFTTEMIHAFPSTIGRSGL